MTGFNWRILCLFGLIFSLVFGVAAWYFGNTVGVRFQLITGLAYAAGLTYLSLKKKND